MSSSSKLPSALVRHKQLLEIASTGLLIRYMIRRQSHNYETCWLNVAGGAYHPTQGLSNFIELGGAYHMGLACMPLEETSHSSHGSATQAVEVFADMIERFEKAAISDSGGYQLKLLPQPFVGVIVMPGGDVYQLAENASYLQFHHGIIGNSILRRCKEIVRNTNTSLSMREAADCVGQRMGSFLGRVRKIEFARNFGIPTGLRKAKVV